jgi:hypothetical protein
LLPSSRRLALLFALQRAAGTRELADRIGALALVVLWAELAAAGGRNDHRPSWMPTRAPARARGLKLARSSITGRRARG